MLVRPRPMMALCAELRDKYGLAVTYEDAPADPATELDVEIVPRNGVRSLTPKRKPITFHISSSLPTLAGSTASAGNTAAADPSVALAAVQDLADQYNKSGNPGQFSGTQDGSYLHVQQTARMLAGKLQPFEPVSGTLLSWQPKPESCYRVLTDLSAVLAQKGSFGLALGVLPSNLWMYPCSIDKESVTLRQVIDAIVAGLDTDPASGKKVTSSGYAEAWDLVYDANWNKYFLSFYPVRLDSLATAANADDALPQAAASQAASQKVPNRTGASTSTRPPN